MLSAGVVAGPAGAAFASQLDAFELTSDDFDQIDPNMPRAETGIPRELPVFDMEIARLQILMDREGLSPGAINGNRNDYFDRTLKLLEARLGVRGLLNDPAAVEALLGKGGEAFLTYELSPEDVAGPFLASLPARIQDQSGFRRMHYMRVTEKIAERFHMDENFLIALNPGVDFARPGAKVKVADIGRYLDRWIARVHADKKKRQVTAYDASGRIMAVYPASIGSAQTPSPKGRFTVRNKAGFPAYTLAPDNGFELIDDGRQRVVAPGPNNPVGVAWIGLSKKTYGIHGTPEPSTIGSAESHGCIRLTNWDAMELARLVRTGVEVVID